MENEKALDKKDDIVILDNSFIVKRYDVSGAGALIIEFPWRGITTGKAIGIELGCTWGEYGEAGGVMDADVMRQLISDMTEWLERFDTNGGKEAFQESYNKSFLNLYGPKP